MKLKKLAKKQLTSIIWAANGRATVIRASRACNILGVTPQAITKLRRHEEANDDRLVSPTSCVSIAEVFSKSVIVDNFRSSSNKGSSI
jgi:hypothetical protein